MWADGGMGPTPNLVGRDYGRLLAEKLPNLLRSPTVAAMRAAGVGDEQIEALLAALWNLGVTITYEPARTHIEWKAGTVKLAAATEAAATEAG